MHRRSHNYVAIAERRDVPLHSGHAVKVIWWR